MKYLSCLITFFLSFNIQIAFALKASEVREVKQLQEWYPYYGCLEDKVFKQCFKWTREECEVTTQQTLKSCLNQHEEKMKAYTKTPIDDWKQKILDCAFRDVNAKLKSRSIESLYCQNKGVGK